MVALREDDDSPVYVGPDFDDDSLHTADEVQDIILWMDHRAGIQADAINSTDHPLLQYVGGKMSVEMEIPKALWLKDNMPPGAFEHCKFYDLSDFLTHKATGSEARSFCSVVCKQGYVPVGIDGSIKGWSREFLESIGLGELAKTTFVDLAASMEKMVRFCLQALLSGC